MIARQFTLAVLLLTTAAIAAERTEMKPEQIWQGSAKEESKDRTVPKVITNAEKLAEAWKACERTDPVPAVDFKKQIAVALTTRGSHVNPRASLSAEGDLRVMGMETRDFRPGFRYVIAVYSRESVKSINGKSVL
jgi:hypothetical protein